MSEVTAGANTARQAVSALRGYAYQLLSAALAWMDLPEDAVLYLEVAEDYAIVANQALEAVQVKDTYQSGTVTLNTESVRDAVKHFVELQENHPSIRVHLRFLTTSEIGAERINPLPNGQQGLRYWQLCSIDADVGPLRQVLGSPQFSATVHAYCKARDDSALRSDLLQRIHWDCGRPDFSVLRQELQEQLVVLCKERFHVPAMEISTLPDLLLSLVLRKSILEDASERVLKRSDLDSAIDEATRISLPRSLVTRLELLLSDALPRIKGVSGGAVPVVSDPGWLIDSNTLADQPDIISRDTLEASIADALRTYAVCVLSGSSGIGKSTVARSAMAQYAQNSCVVDFRDLSADDARSRLDVLFAHIGDLPSANLILDDLNTLHDTRVARSAGRLVGALHRRALLAIVTCYRSPSQDALATMGLGKGSVVLCTYFSKAETGLLVAKYGGKPEKWAEVAHLSGGHGHPQLVHAFIRGMSDRDWPSADSKDLVRTRTSPVGLEAVREEARRRLIESLPIAARTLLYRLSIAVVHFNRSTAVTIGATSPELSQVGEHFDALSGSWIETVGPDLFRVSPLAQDFGTQMLGRDEKIRVHNTISAETLKKTQLILSDANGILTHALEGKSEQSLVLLAWRVLSAEANAAKALGEHFSVLRDWVVTTPMYADDAAVSATLRVAQLQLTISSGGVTDLTPLVAAVFREIEAVDKLALRHALEARVLRHLLTTEGIANRVSSWVELVVRAGHAALANPVFADFSIDVETRMRTERGGFLGVLFTIGSTRIASVARLENIVEGMDRLDASERAVWLRPMEEAFADYSILIASAWSIEDAEGRLNSGDAVARYGRMVARTRKWGVPALSAQCSVAQAVLLDRYEGDRDAALSVLGEAETFAPGDVVLIRARAGVHYRHGEYVEALALYPGVLAGIRPDDLEQQAFVIREAAICAGQCGRWPQAETWFVQARNAALQVNSQAMVVMATALEADTAGAALMAGNVEDALRRFANALERADPREMPDTLSAAYCQRLVRHAAMWCFSRIDDKEFLGADGKPLVFEPGMCSNPEPMDEIRRHPLVPSDAAWYMLAQAEAAAGVDAGIGRTLKDRVANGPIPALEAGLRWREIARNIDRLDADGVVANLVGYLQSAMYLHENKGQVESSWDPMNPERGEIPPLSDEVMRSPLVESGARGCILAFAIRAVFVGRMEAIDELELLMEERYGTGALGARVFEDLGKREALAVGPEAAVIEAVRVIGRGGFVDPEACWGVGFCLFRWMEESDFERVLLAPFAVWLRRQWTRIVREESFQLVTPMVTVPVVTEVLGIPENNREFVVKLLHVTLDAAIVTGRARWREMLRPVAVG